jgi:hypothetical protein
MTIDKQDYDKLIKERDYLKSLLVDVILCMPGYAGCGDISRENRTHAECVKVLKDKMPIHIFPVKGN